MKTVYYRRFAPKVQHSQLVDYILLACALVLILLLSLVISFLSKQEPAGYIRVFMGIFFLVFALAKLLYLENFTSSFVNYDLIAKKYPPYAYTYPWLQLFLAVAYFLNFPAAIFLTIIITVVGGVGIVQEMLAGRTIISGPFHHQIDIPLSTVSLIENLTMASMALILGLGLFS